jgi:hypothetical protein
MNRCHTERDKSRVPSRAFCSKMTGAGTYTSACSVNTLVWVPNVIPTSVKLLRIFKVLMVSTLLRLSQHMDTLNSVLSLGMSLYKQIST